VFGSDRAMRWIQYEGGTDTGNSGSPLVDTKGVVRVVHKARLPDSSGRFNTMRFGVPAEYAARLIQGVPLEIEPGRNYLDGSTNMQPVKVTLGDPLKRIKKVSVDYWVGNNGQPRQPTDKTPKTSSGDGTRQTVELKYDAEKQTAAGDFALPSA